MAIVVAATVGQQQNDARPSRSIRTAASRSHARFGAVVSPDGQRLCISTGRGGTIIGVDTATNNPLASVAVGTRPWGLALSPAGTRLYTANGPSNDVSVVDTATLTLITKIPVGQSPWGVAIVERSR